MTCCRCNGSSRCIRCDCVRKNRRCTNCLPSRKQRCQNLEKRSSSSTQASSSLSNEPQASSSLPLLSQSPLTSSIDRPAPTPASSSNRNWPSQSPTQTPTLTPTHAVSAPSLPHRDDRLPYLPPSEPLSAPQFKWGNGESSLDGPDFCTAIEAAYLETRSWRKNLFLVPSGAAGKTFVDELTRLFEAFAQSTAMECVALKAAMTAPTLLLQKPSRKSKSKEHSQCLNRRLKLWAEGRINDLVLEGRTIQKYLPKNRSSDSEESRLAQRFAQLMTTGKIQAALRLLSEDSANSLLEPSESVEDPEGLRKTVKELLVSKHPEGRSYDINSSIPDNEIISPTNPHPILFDQINESTIRFAALRTKGGAGPSGIDAAGWRRLCCSFGRSSSDLCKALAHMARRLCTTYVHPECIQAYNACRLIALNKFPGIRPIGICEVVRRIIGKAIMTLVKDDVIDATGPTQLCAGQLAGCEAGVHTLNSLFESRETDGVLLVDATNTFNQLNRQAVLHNIQSLCPSLAHILINCYREPVQMHLSSGEIIWSKEGTTQGDPLGMTMYALGMAPPIQKLNLKCPSVNQLWFADDSSAASSLKNLLEWWESLLELGPSFGYEVNVKKCWLVVKPHLHDQALSLFHNTGLQISVNGCPYLGAAIGQKCFIDDLVSTKVSVWVKEIETLSNIAQTQPHAAYSGLIHGVLSKWAYLQRTIPDVSHLFQPLEDALRHQLLPAITGQSALNDVTRRVLELPARLGGLGITNPAISAQDAYDASRKICNPLQKAILQPKEDSPSSYLHEQAITKEEVKRNLRRKNELKKETLQNQSTSHLKRSLILNSQHGASAWLTALPLKQHNFWLHKGDFRDALCLRYNWPMKFMS